MTKKLTPLIYLGALACSQAAIAQQTLIGKPNSDIENITVLGKAATDGAYLGGIPLKQLPLNSHIIGQAEIERLQFVDPNELLDRIPGETQVRNLRIPDGGKSYTIPMLDGVPLESPYEGATSRLNRTNTFDIQRVEIIKGPTSALYPNNAFGGIVNVVTRDAPKQTETKVFIEGGDFNRLRTGLARAGTINKFGYFISANTQNIDGLRDLTQDDREQGSAKLEYKPSVHTKITARVEYLAENEVSRGDLAAAQIAENPRQAGDLSSSTDLEQNTASIGLVHHFTSGQLTANFVRREKDTLGASRFRGPQDENDLAHIAKITYHHNADWADWTVGFSRYDGEQNIKQFGRQDLELTGPFTPITQSLLLDAYFAQYQLEAAQDLAIILGARYEDISLSSSEFSNQEGQFSKLAPKLGVTYQLNPNNLVWASISEGFYAPQADDLFAIETDTNEQGQEVVVAQGDPNLKPEEALNIEIGIRGDWRNWHYDTSVYHNDITNYLVTQEFDLPNGGEFEQTTNAGKVSIQGIESVIEFAPKDAKWRAALTHTYTDNTYDSFVQSTPGADDDLTGKVLRRSPDHHVNIRLAWLPLDGLSAELEADVYSHYFADNNNSPEAKFTRGERINLRLNYNLDHWRLWVHGLNLTDTLEDRATFRRNTLSLRTINGRTFYAGASYTF
jgi:outer membrane receptor protein involved in Fe transport